MSNPGNPVIETALELQTFCKQQKWRFCFIGGIAVQRWSEPRFTNDADLTLVCDFGDEDRYLKPLLAHYKARRDNAEIFARANRVLLLLSSTDVPIDVALGATGFEQRTVERASLWKVTKNQSLLTCCAEDLLTHKAFASRTKDWLDVENILLRQRGKLNFDLVWRELHPLIELKEAPEIEDQLKKLIAKVDRISR